MVDRYHHIDEYTWRNNEAYFRIFRRLSYGRLAMMLKTGPLIVFQSPGFSGDLFSLKVRCPSRGVSNQNPPKILRGRLAVC